MTSAPTYDVLGLPISTIPPSGAVEEILTLGRSGQGGFVCFRDVASTMACADDKTLCDLHQDAALVLPDGMPLVWIGRRLGFPVKRNCGPDTFDAVCKASVDRRLKHYFYGGNDGVAEQLKLACEVTYPGIKIVGTETPPFAPLGDSPDPETVARINASKADIVWVGMSSPKQDHWMWLHFRDLPQVLVGVGAAFDFHSGQIQRAPIWMQRSGLEWVHRLAQEPRRLWRRYLIVAPQFLIRMAPLLRRKSGSK